MSAGLTTYLTPAIAIVLGMLAAIAGRSHLGPTDADTSGPAAGALSDSLVIAVRAAVGLAATSGIFATSHVFGASIDGAVGSFPSSARPSPA